MAQILEIEAYVDRNKNSLWGQAYVSGDHKGIEQVFNDGDRLNAVAEVEGGLTGTETKVRFSYHPAQEGLKRLDSLVWSNQPTDLASTRWQQARPELVSRLAQIRNS